MRWIVQLCSWGRYYSLYRQLNYIVCTCCAGHAHIWRIWPCIRRVCKLRVHCGFRCCQDTQGEEKKLTYVSKHKTLQSGSFIEIKIYLLTVIFCIFTVMTRAAMYTRVFIPSWPYAYVNNNPLTSFQLFYVQVLIFIHPLSSISPHTHSCWGTTRIRQCLISFTVLNCERIADIRSLDFH